MWSVHVADGVNVLRMFKRKRIDKMGAGVGECTDTVPHTREQKTLVMQKPGSNNNCLVPATFSYCYFDYS